LPLEQGKVGGISERTGFKFIEVAETAPGAKQVDIHLLSGAAAHIWRNQND